MTLTQHSAPSMPEFMRRLAVTLVALAVYGLGTHIPLAGISQTALADLYGASGLALVIERVSIFVLGVTPLISALLLVELARLVSERFNNWVDAAPTNASRVNRYALIGALLLAALQGNGIANALEAAGDFFIAKPGLQFHLNVMATCVASTAFLAWLATLISRNGLGSGIWILLLTSILAGLPDRTLTIFKAVQSGSLSEAGVVVTLAYIIIALATITALARALTELRMPLERALIWPPYIAFGITGTLAAVALAVRSSFMGDAVTPFFLPGAPTHAVALAVVMIVITLAQWQRLKPRPTMVAPSSPPAAAVNVIPTVFAALIMATIMEVPWMITTYFGIPMLIDGISVVTMAVVALPILDLLQGQQA